MITMKNTAHNRTHTEMVTYKLALENILEHAERLQNKEFHRERIVTVAKEALGLMNSVTGK